MDTISIGKHNPLLADIRRAIQRDTLTDAGLLPIEGPRLIQEAYASDVPIEVLLLRDPKFVDQAPPATVVYMLDESAFKTIQGTGHSQGVMGLVRPHVWALSDVLGNLQRPAVVLAGLQDPGNVGTILRVAEAFGAGGCLALSGTAAVYNAKVVRSSAGSVFRLPHVWNLDFAEVVDALNERKIPLVGTSPHATESIMSWDWKKPAAILIGNEGAGLSSEQVSACRALLQIPKEPQTESLNSAVAAAVVLYEAARKRYLS